mmetsp:Transcript_28508/g.87305  ORF Transcript_28508/g.87305 Transcript_28508/m.87305 type:complete len:175 (+) Transcript_28508:94-618(+)
MQATSAGAAPPAKRAKTDGRRRQNPRFPPEMRVIGLDPPKSSGRRSAIEERYAKAYDWAKPRLDAALPVTLADLQANGLDVKTDLTSLWLRQTPPIKVDGEIADPAYYRRFCSPRPADAQFQDLSNQLLTLKKEHGDEQLRDFLQSFLDKHCTPTSVSVSPSSPSASDAHPDLL